jgi:hypothetical protein
MVVIVHPPNRRRKFAKLQLVLQLDLAKYAYRKPSAGGVFENSLAFQSVVFKQLQL